jgi:hypothetical protein
MQRSTLFAACLLAASAWAAETPPAIDCGQIESEIARTEQARRAAVEQSETAWKAVVPFVVLARKASAKSALDEADKRLTELKTQAARCEGAHER